MDRAIELAAKVNYENWGGSWRSATEDRKMQSRKEVIKIFEEIRSDASARSEVEDFLFQEVSGSESHEVY